MEITREEVLRCAELAKLSLREEEIEPLRAAMAQLLDRARKLDALDLDGVAPMLHPLPLALPRRADEPGPCLSQAEALANAPEARQGHFVVPKVL